MVGLTNIQNLQDLQNSKVSRMPDSAPPRWNVEAPSANAICTIDYFLPQVYSFYVIPIDVQSHNTTSNKSTHVKSRKLRHKAIHELIEGKLPRSSSEFTYAIQSWVESKSTEHPIDHFIIQFRTNTKLLELTRAITSIGNDFPAEFPAKRTVMSVRDLEGALVEGPVMCKVHRGMTFQPEKQLSPGQNSEDYRKKFGALMIFGAYIAQAGSDSSQHCPSVAAVVANIVIWLSTRDRSGFSLQRAKSMKNRPPCLLQRDNNTGT